MRFRKRKMPTKMQKELREIISYIILYGLATVAIFFIFLLTYYAIERPEEFTPFISSLILMISLFLAYKIVNWCVNNIQEIDITVISRTEARKPELEGDGYDDAGNLIYDTGYCPKCHHEFEVDYDTPTYCPDCGQKLDWRGVE